MGRVVPGRENRVAKRLAAALPGRWHVEGDGDTTAYAYQVDPHGNIPPSSERAGGGVSIYGPGHMGPGWTVQTSGWNEMRGIHDVIEGRDADSLSDAVKLAVSMSHSVMKPMDDDFGDFGGGF